MNPLYEQFNRPNGQMNDMMSRFQQFKRSFNGDPQQIVQQMLNSGRITQDQFNRAAQMANQWMRFMR